MTMNDNRPQLVLASNSPRRRELLRQAGYRFEVRPPTVDEHAVAHILSPGAYVESLAYLKAAAAIDAYGLARGLVLGADTVVALGGRLIGKPTDEAEARHILSQLSGSEHAVLTGLALVDLDRGRRYLAHEETHIRMRRMTSEEIDAYVASGEALGKAGAYALQETGDRYVESMDGSMTNVVGLPMELLERLLKAAGYEPGNFKE
jgi:septum formation protein